MADGLACGGAGGCPIRLPGATKLRG
jgi:hypothetical protein